MAARTFRKPETIGLHRVILGCNFKPNGTSQPDQATLRGPGFASVNRTGVGVFDLKLQDPYMELESFAPALMQNAAGNLVAELVTETVSDVSDPKVTIRVVNKSTGAATDISAHANNRIGVMLFLKNTSL